MDGKQKIELVELCVRHKGMMWSASVLAIIFECDFRESERIAEAWLTEIKKA